MAQQRFYDFVTTLTSDVENLIRSEILPKGVYSGYDLAPNGVGDQLVIGAPGALVQPTGIVIRETVNRTISFSGFIGAPPLSLTVTQRHTDNSLIGGTAAVYAIETGTLLSSAVTDGVILGWIFYPGGSVPLAQSHILQSQKQRQDLLVTGTKDAAPITRHAEFDGAIVSTLGANTTFTAALWDAAARLVVAQFENGIVGLETSVYSFNFVAGPTRPRSLDLFLLVPAPGPGAGDNQVAVTVYDTTDTLVTIESGGTIGPTGGVFTTNTVLIDRSDGTFTEGSVWSVDLTFQLRISAIHQLAWIRANMWPYPDPF